MGRAGSVSNRSTGLFYFEDGIAKLNGEIAKAIADTGVYVKHERGYSYTVGMAKIRSPELIIFGESAEVAEEVFYVIYQAVELGLVVVEDNTRLDQIFKPAPVMTRFPDSAKVQYFYAARAYFESWDFPAFRVSVN
jgi:hypothetical protein